LHYQPTLRASEYLYADFAIATVAGLVDRLPVFAAEAINPFELAEIASDDDKTTAARMSGYQNIVTADLAPLSLKCGTNIAGMGGGVSIEGKHFKSACEALDFASVLDRSG